MHKEYISDKQCMFLILGFIVGTAIMLIPTSAIGLAKQDAWLSPLVSAVPGLMLLAILLTLNKMYPGQSLVQYSESILGWPGKLLSLVILWFSLHLASLVLRNIGNFVNFVLLFETPLSLVHIVVVAVAAYGLRLGIEALAKCLSLLMVLSVLFFILVQIYSIGHVDFAQLLPILSNGLLPVAAAGIQISAFPVGELVVFSLIFFHVKHSKGTNLYIAGGLLGGLFILILSIERVITFMGPEMASRTLYSVLMTVSGIRGGNLFETVVSINWYAYSITKFTLCYYAFVVGTSHWFKMSDFKPLILPGGALITVFSLFLYENAIHEIEFSSRIFTVYALPIEYGIPLVLLIAALIKSGIKDSGQKSSSKEEK